MSNFSNYTSELGARDYEITALEGTPTLTLYPATLANKELTAAALKASRRTRQPLSQASMSVTSIDADRDVERGLFAKHVIRDWHRVFNSAGEAVPFSKENALEFLHSIPDWIFDEIREFAQSNINFMEDAAKN